MARVGGAVAALVAVLALAPAAGSAQEIHPPTGWGGKNPYKCRLQYAGFKATGDDPGADPYCVYFDKRKQDVTELGVLQFLSLEPARVAAASDKCFYYQDDVWRGSIVQSDGRTKTYEWHGHYFFDKARGEGGLWVKDFSVNGRSGDPSALPFPDDFRKYMGSGRGGARTDHNVPVDPACVARAQREPHKIYR